MENYKLKIENNILDYNYDILPMLDSSVRFGLFLIIIFLLGFIIYRGKAQLIKDIPITSFI